MVGEHNPNILNHQFSPNSSFTGSLITSDVTQDITNTHHYKKQFRFLYLYIFFVLMSVMGNGGQLFLPLFWLWQPCVNGSCIILLYAIPYFSIPLLSLLFTGIGRFCHRHPMIGSVMHLILFAMHMASLVYYFMYFRPHMLMTEIYLLSNFEVYEECIFVGFIVLNSFTTAALVILNACYQCKVMVFKIKSN